MKESMINVDGSIRINLKKEDVTWFNFLRCSRISNSNEGGWNSKSYWVNGLNRLLKKEFIKDWTTNSFKSEIPLIRNNRNFKLKREMSDERQKLITKDCPSIGKISENEINAKLYIRKDCFKDYSLIGYEIPLVNQKDGQLKIDLLAEMKNDTGLGIIELKKADNEKDSPLMALTELICYGIQLYKCKDNFIEQTKEFSEEHFKKINLLIAAPQDYWDNWKMNEELKNSLKKIINDGVNKSIAEENCKFELTCVQINDNFSTQEI